MRHIIPISGKDSLSTALVQMRRAPGLPYEFVYNDTTMELPETYEWLLLVEKTLGIQIHRIGKNLEQVISEQGILPSANVRFCTRLTKIIPLQDWIGAGIDATVYLGIRADEDRIGYTKSEHITPCYPLQEEGIDLHGVYALVDSVSLMPPTFFWKRVYDAVLVEMGASAFIIQDLPRYLFDRMFAWRSRPNCFMCFYQRRYEWAGLLEFHPDLFERAEKIERGVGGENDDRSSAFYWIGQGMPLSYIRERFDELVQKRVNSICGMLIAMLQTELFDETEDGMDAAATSCGLFCGK